MSSAAVRLDFASEQNRSASAIPRSELPVGATIALSPRIVSALRDAGIETFHQLASLDDDDLLSLGSIGYVALREIRQVLQHLGFAASPARHQVTFGTPLEAELWQLTAPAGGVVERGIAMIHFGWNGRVPLEQIRNRYRVKRDLLRQIFLRVETQPVPENRDAIRRVARFVRDHTPCWSEDVEQLLITAGLTRQRVTAEGIVNACRIAGIDAGIELLRTPRPLAVPVNGIDVCRAIIRSVQHLAAIRGMTTIDEVKSCAETLTGSAIDRKFTRRAVALLSDVRWLDQDLGIVTIHRTSGRQRKADRTKPRRRMRRVS